MLLSMLIHAVAPAQGGKHTTKQAAAIPFVPGLSLKLPWPEAMQSPAPTHNYMAWPTQGLGGGKEDSKCEVHPLVPIMP